MKGSKRPKNSPQRFLVTKDGEGIANHVGSVALRDLADALGLTRALSEAMAPRQERRPTHDRGAILRDLVVMLADGGDCVSDLSALRDQPVVFGEVASTATAWRLINGLKKKDLKRIRKARALARERAWRRGGTPREIVLDLDATLVTSHSEKEKAAPNFKRGFGFHPVMCYLEETDEALAGKLRTGNATANDSADNIEVLELALEQLPKSAFKKEILVRGDSACATHALVEKVREQGLKFSFGMDLYDAVREAVLNMKEEDWTPAVTQTGEEREGAAVCELDALDLSSWPTGTRAICRRERPHPGAQLKFTDANGYRFQVFITDQSGDIVELEARHRGRARVENRIRCGKDTGLENLPFHDFHANRAWLELILTAQDLIAFFQRLCLRGEAKEWEPKTLRYRLFHTAARLVRSGRRLILRLQKSWRWTPMLYDAFQRVRLIAAAG
ncbi:MAG TPA: IS1380 family transposase [Ktedonobacterales bacterium]|nr:IS1380 family transposase [Ktedonobacterales bacterium]